MLSIVSTSQIRRKNYLRAIFSWKTKCVCFQSSIETWNNFSKIKNQFKHFIIVKILYTCFFKNIAKTWNLRRYTNIMQFFEISIFSLIVFVITTTQYIIREYQHEFSRVTNKFENQILQNKNAFYLQYVLFNWTLLKFMRTLFAQWNDIIKNKQVLTQYFIWFNIDKKMRIINEYANRIKTSSHSTKNNLEILLVESNFDENNFMRVMNKKSITRVLNDVYFDKNINQ